MALAITMPRGDIRPVNFTVKETDGTLADIDFSEIYFTVKQSYTRSKYLFQKKLSTGEIQLLDNGSYQFIIEHADTDGLNFGKYVFDIELIAGEDLKQTFVGDFIIEREATHIVNEV